MKLLGFIDSEEALLLSKRAPGGSINSTVSMLKTMKSGEFRCFSNTYAEVYLKVSKNSYFFVYWPIYVQLLCNFMCTYQRIMHIICAPLKPYKWWIFRVASPKKRSRCAYPIWLETMGTTCWWSLPFTLLASLHVGGYRLLFCWGLS